MGEVVKWVEVKKAMDGGDGGCCQFSRHVRRQRDSMNTLHHTTTLTPQSGLLLHQVLTVSFQEHSCSLIIARSQADLPLPLHKGSFRSQGIDSPSTSTPPIGHTLQLH